MKIGEEDTIFVKGDWFMYPNNRKLDLQKENSYLDGQTNLNGYY
jgi:hypothetical protein